MRTLLIFEGEDFGHALLTGEQAFHKADLDLASKCTSVSSLVFKVLSFSNSFWKPLEGKRPSKAALSFVSWLSSPI